jgi:hypothetical protein
MEAIVVAFLTGVLGPVLVIVVKHFYDKRKPKSDLVEDALKVSEQVVTRIESIKDEFHADRVWIQQFHNGGHFYPTGKSIAKFSMTYEVVGPSVQSIQSNFQNIPVSMFSRAINQLLTEDEIAITDFKDETVATYGLKYIAEEVGTRSSYMFAVKTIEGKFIACLGVDYKRKTKLSDESIAHLAVYAAAIGGVLNMSLKV